jgi:hypothetical protein
VLIEIRERPGWTEAHCRCGHAAVVLVGLDVGADETRASLTELIEHARCCEAAADAYQAPDPATARIVERLMIERYPMLNRRG